MKRNNRIWAAADSAAELFGNAEAVAWAVLEELLDENPARV
jgi:hypothetical protein